MNCTCQFIRASVRVLFLHDRTDDMAQGSKEELLTGCIASLSFITVADSSLGRNASW